MKLLDTLFIRVYGFWPQAHLLIDNPETAQNGTKKPVRLSRLGKNYADAQKLIDKSSLTCYYSHKLIQIP
jgi:hypothetical protein